MSLDENLVSLQRFACVQMDLLISTDAVKNNLAKLKKNHAQTLTLVNLFNSIKLSFKNVFTFLSIPNQDIFSISNWITAIFQKKSQNFFFSFHWRVFLNHTFLLKILDNLPTFAGKFLLGLAEIYSSRKVSLKNSS